MELQARTERLDQLVGAAGLRVCSGYTVGETVVACVIRAARPFVVAERDDRLWLLTVVGIGGGVYPEDDIEQETPVKLPPGHRLTWEDHTERAVLARELGATIGVEDQDEIEAFARLADLIEQHLTANDDLDISLDPLADEDLLHRGPLTPPA